MFKDNIDISWKFFYVYVRGITITMRRQSHLNLPLTIANLVNRNSN
jgi:hypothetical protein